MRQSCNLTPESMLTNPYEGMEGYDEPFTPEPGTVAFHVGCTVFARIPIEFWNGTEFVSMPTATHDVTLTVTHLPGQGTCAEHDEYRGVDHDGDAYYFRAANATPA